MHTVSSKYKNPDKLIERLQRKLHRNEKVSDHRWTEMVKAKARVCALKNEIRYMEEIGVDWLNYSNGMVETIMIGRQETAQAAHIGQGVKIFGEITVLRKKDGEYSAEVSLESAKLLRKDRP